MKIVKKKFAAKKIQSNKNNPLFLIITFLGFFAV